MNQYQKKQFTIAIIFIFIIVVVGGGLYFLLRPTPPTCFDGIQNQGEKGIDCGGPCGLCPEDIRKPLEIVFQDFIPTVPSDFDLVAQIKNPNRDWGVESLKYRFNLYSKDNELIGDKEGETYILPQEAKYIIEQRFPVLPLPHDPSLLPWELELKLEEISWRKLKDFEEIELRIKDKELKISEQGFNKLVGNVENKSSYDLDKIQVIGLLFSNSKIIAAGITEMRTILMGETRYFEINWPYKTTEPITSFELKPHTNIFLDENFMRKHGTPERFKEY